MASDRRDPDDPELDSAASSAEASEDEADHDRATEEGRAEASAEEDRAEASGSGPTPAAKVSGTTPSGTVADDPPRARRLWQAGAVLVVLLVLDLVTKQWAWDNLREGAIRIIVDGWVYFEFGFNTGSAFSLLRDASWSRLLFIGITFLALLYMGHLAKTLPTRFTSAFVAIGMVASGALGNLHDRFIRTMIVDGVERYGVVDFIKVYYWKGKPWPTFNIADVALVAGVLLLLLFLLRHGDVLDEQAEQAKQAKAPAA